MSFNPIFLSHYSLLFSHTSDLFVTGGKSPLTTFWGQAITHYSSTLLCEPCKLHWPPACFYEEGILKTRHFLTIWFLLCQFFCSWPHNIYHFSLKKGGKKVERCIDILKNCGRLIISLCIPFALQQWIEMAEHQLLSLPQGLSQLISVIPVFQVPSAPLHQATSHPHIKKHLSEVYSLFSWHLQ